MPRLAGLKTKVLVLTLAAVHRIQHYETIPIRWFTLFVVAEFVLGVVIFSLISFATSGYNLVSVYSSNPNATESHQVLPGLPALLTRKATASCQSIEIGVGNQFSTNNSALVYTLNRIQQGESTSPSVVYHNNHLEDCVIHDVMIVVDFIGRNAAQIALQTYGFDLSSSMTCFLSADSARTAVNLTARYNYIPTGATIYDGQTVFVGRNRTNKASLFWGEEALALYWVALADAYYYTYMDGTVDGDGAYTKASLYLTPNDNVTTDITSTAFFGATQRSIATNSGQLSVLSNLGPDSIESLASSQPFWFEADALAKIFHSTIITDLGQQTYKGSNILADAELLQYFTSTEIYDRSFRDGRAWMVDTAEREGHDYNSLKNTTGPLGVQPSVIAARYLCHVPHLKSTGDLMLSALVADLVLLQLLWKITMWITTWAVERRDSRAMWCEGCVRTEEEPDESALVQLLPKGVHSVSGSEAGQSQTQSPAYHGSAHMTTPEGRQSVGRKPISSQHGESTQYSP